MNTFFLKGRNLTLQTSFVRDGQNKVGISDKFLCAFEVIAFYTVLDYEKFYVKGSKTFFELFDIEPNESSKDLFSEETVNNSFLFVFPRLGTISPWSSKAQNILDNTFRGVIDRVERCQIFLFDLSERNEDLSSYDVIANLPFTIPFYGNHISLFPLLASIAIFFYSRFTAGQQMQPSQPGMPNMKFIIYLMPVMLLFFFNNYSSGFSLYYFISNLLMISIFLKIYDE